MAVEVKYLTSATSTFLSLQSGFARPYWEANITVSGAATTVSATLGQSYGEKDTYTVFLSHFEGADGSTGVVDIYGHSTNCLTGVVHDNAQKKFGATSILFDGVGSMLVPDSDDWYFGTGDMTIDAWVMLNTLPADGTFMSIWGQYDGVDWVEFYIGNYAGGGNVYIIGFNDSKTGIVVDSEAITIVTGVWYHCAIVRKGTSFKLFFNCQQVGATVVDANEISNVVGDLEIGANSGDELDGWIDELRASKKCRWFEAFNVPTREYDKKLNNDIISMGTIDRAKPVSLWELSQMFAGDVTFTLNNASELYSPLATASIFTDAAGSALDYMQSKIRVWAGFENTSGTAYTVQRGEFLLTKLRLDSKSRTAYITAQDAARVPLAGYVGLPEDSGTATTWTCPTGDGAGNIMTELLSAVGLSASQYDISTGISFPAYSLVSASVSDSISKLAQASDGYIYTNGKGQVVFDLNSPKFEQPASNLALKNTDRILDLSYNIDIQDLTQKVQMNFAGGTRTAKDVSVTKGCTQIISNSAIDRGSIAESLVSRYLSVYSVNRPTLEIDGVWLPSLEIGDTFTVTDTGTHQNGVSYEVYRLREDITKCKTKIYAVDLTNNEIYGSSKKKWGFLSDTSATSVANNSGGSEFTNAWHSGFAFVCNTTTGFDDDGDNNNTINTGLAVSGAGTTGIENPFLVY
jgi:hypothetical protein